MKIWENGTVRDMTAHERSQMEQEARRADIEAASRPLTDAEILRLDMRRRVNDMGIDHQTAGRMVACFPTRAECCAEGGLIRSGTRVRDDVDETVIWRANADLWNTPENNPENAPSLWDRVAYHKGIRIIPDVIPATLAFMKGELGWRDGCIYQSGMDGNVHLPGMTGAAWEKMV